MSAIPPDLRYTTEHEWVRVEAGLCRIGITDFAQERLGDVVYLELPAEGAEVTAGDPMGEVESTKSVSDVFAPVSGTVEEVNAECRENPAAVNQDPYGDGWLAVIRVSDPDAVNQLLSAGDYETLVASLDEG
ncbi:MAG TPA: glycine cleavage system protein GcvH [Actinomycetota bacterium]|nr:glycine cleavage system protein GcvH [Actinomycetota bacterium]